MFISVQLVTLSTLPDMDTNYTTTGGSETTIGGVGMAYHKLTITGYIEHDDLLVLDDAVFGVAGILGLHRVIVHYEDAPPDPVPVPMPLIEALPEPVQDWLDEMREGF